MAVNQSQVAKQESEIDHLRPWVEAETGMDFSGERITRLHDAVAKVLSPPNAPIDLDRLPARPQDRGVFLERLTGELTVGESYFFRNEHQFRALREHVLPEILRDNADRREVRIWSAGCAGGEEPYSLAILLDQVLGARRDWRVSILGTDLNPEFLERARQACFRLWSFRHTHIHEDRSYFECAGDTFRLRGHLRDRVRFAYLNLVKDVYPSPLTGTLGLDLILFRNVAIYLKPEVTRSIIGRFQQALRPGGWLLLGETEVGLAPTEGFETRRFEQATFHHKPRGAPTALREPPTAMPVLSGFVQQTPFPKIPFQAAPQPPALPDWVPLPRQHQVASQVDESAAQQFDQLLAARKFDEAERAVDRMPDQRQRAKYRFALAQSLLACASAARARLNVSRCLADEPLMIEAQLLEASFAEEAGDLDAAENAYRRALYVDRSCPMSHFHLALVQQRKGDAAGAKRSIKTMLKLIDGKDPHELVQYGEGVCYGRLKEMAVVICNV